jgi:phage terminase large subunit
MSPLDESLIRRAAYRRRIEALGEAGKRAERMLCAEDIVHWFNQWVFTFDPRIDAPKTRPFDLWPRQAELLHWLRKLQRLRKPGLCDKSRDSGVTWLAVGHGYHACQYTQGAKIGYGSYKLEKVDKLGDPDSIFEKARILHRNLPEWLRPRLIDKQCNLVFPETGSSMTGEGGDDVGRGGRTSIYFWDEAAFSEHPQKVEAALMGNTDVQVDISTPNGPGNPFAVKRFGGNVDVFSFEWSHDPRKTQAYIDQKVKEKGPVLVAQEYLLDYNASIEGICIPALWVRAAVNLLPREDAHGPIIVGFDVAEEGNDRSIMIGRQGPIAFHPHDLGNCNTTEMAWRARDCAEKMGAGEVIYDAGGPGVGIKGTWQTYEGKLPFLASAIPFGGEPTETVWPDGRTAHEIFLNRRAEMWWTLRQRFERAYEYKVEGKKHPIDELISIPNCSQLIAELSLPLKKHTDRGKIKIESKDDMKRRGVKSPDYADALALAFHTGPGKRRFQIW